MSTSPYNVSVLFRSAAVVVTENAPSINAGFQSPAVLEIQVTTLGVQGTPGPSGGGTGGGPAFSGAVSFDLLPDVGDTRDLGTTTKAFRNLFLTYLNDPTGTETLNAASRTLTDGLANIVFDFSNGISVENQRIKNVGVPTASADAANKAYVDTAIAGAPSGGAVDPAQKLSIFDDFAVSYYGTNGQIFGDKTWCAVATGSSGVTAQSAIFPSTNAHPGILEFSAAANGSGAGISTGLYGGAATTAFQAGNGLLLLEALVFIQLSDGTNNSQIDIGFSDSPGWAGASNKMSLYYQRETSLNWLMITSNAGVANVTISTAPVTAGWNKIRVEISANGSTMSGYVNGTLACTSTTNVPIMRLPPMISLRKTLGEGAMYLGLDYLKIEKSFTTPR